MNPYEYREADTQARWKQNHGTSRYAVMHGHERVATVFARDADHACSMTARKKKLPPEYQLTAQAL